MTDLYRVFIDPGMVKPEFLKSIAKKWSCQIQVDRDGVLSIYANDELDIDSLLEDITGSLNSVDERKLPYRSGDALRWNGQVWVASWESDQELPWAKSHGNTVRITIIPRPSKTQTEMSVEAIEQYRYLSTRMSEVIAVAKEDVFSVDSEYYPELSKESFIATLYPDEICIDHEGNYTVYFMTDLRPIHGLYAKYLRTHVLES